MALYSIDRVWNLLDSLGRPSLALHLQVQALELNERGLRLLRGEVDGGGDAVRTLYAALSAGAACWQVLRPLLTEPQRRSLDAGLRRQQRLLRPLRTFEADVIDRPELVVRRLATQVRKPAEGRCLARFLDRIESADEGVAIERPLRVRIEEVLMIQSQCLGELPRTAPEAVLRQALVGVYRKARKALRDQPRSNRARRRAEALTWVEGLLDAEAGPTFDGRLPDTAAGRLWRGLEEDRWLRTLGRAAAARQLGDKELHRLARLVRRRRRELADVNRDLMKHVFEATPTAYRERLRWQVFARLAEPPVPISVGRASGAAGNG